MPSLDLSLLPAPQVVESLDFETLFKQRKATFIALSPPQQQAARSATRLTMNRSLSPNCCKKARTVN